MLNVLFQQRQPLTGSGQTLDFFNEANRGNSLNPVFVDEYHPLNLSLTYLVNDDLAVSFEGLHNTTENIRQYGRTESQLRRNR